MSRLEFGTVNFIFEGFKYKNIKTEPELLIKNRGQIQNGSILLVKLLTFDYTTNTSLVNIR
jgi:hypothetical protein